MNISEHLSAALQYLMQISATNEADIVKKTTIPQPTINRLLRGKTPDPRVSTLKILAQHFNVTIDQLVGKDPICSEVNFLNLYKLGKNAPIITWHDVMHYPDVLRKIQNNGWNHWTVSSNVVGEQAFALLIDKDFSLARFSQGTTIIVDPDCEIRDRNYVVVRLQHQKTPILKQLFIEPQKKYFRSILPEKKFVEATEKDHIFGVIVESKMQLYEHQQ